VNRSLRKTNLARLQARRADGIHLAPFEQGEIGPDLFSPSHDWIRVNNPKSPAFISLPN
jgi:hypothetical protein